MRGLLGRRRALALATGTAASLTTAACAPPAPSGSVSAAQVYVGLGKARQVAILDAASDRVVGRVPLGSFGDRGAPAQIGVGPSGAAAVLPLVSTSPSIALIHQADAMPAAGGGRRFAPRPTPRAAWLPLGRGAEPTEPSLLTGAQTAQRLASDARGHAYVVIGDGAGSAGPTLAVLDLRTGEVTRRHLLGGVGEAVTALYAAPDGSRVYVATWRWADATPTTTGGGAWPSSPLPPVAPHERFGRLGRLVALDPLTGARLALATLPSNAAVSDLVLASAPAGSARAGEPTLYASVQIPGPMRDEALTLSADRHFEIVSLDPEFLDVTATWPTDRAAGTFAVTPNGARAYLLSGSGVNGSPSRELLCVDLATGHTDRRWPLPDGCFSLTLSSVGKLYVADALGDRLWRVDVARNVMLGDIPLPGAPLTVAARPA